MPASVFTRLCDLVDDLGRLEHRLPHSAEQLALGELIDRFDSLIDDTVGLERTIELDLDDTVARGV